MRRLLSIQHRIRNGGILCVMFCSSRMFSTTRTTEALEVAVITGTTRTEGPPRPILGPRVARFITDVLEERGHRVTAIDPREFPLLEKPHFSYAKSQVPAHMEKVHLVLKRADAYVCVTPEYNHAPSPALVNVLNHFGSSTFSYKPSAIVSYSAGQWGGQKAAIALRPILSELGCLPVSAMIHIPSAQDVLEEEGHPHSNQDPQKWKQYCGRCFSQLEWWGNAARNYKSEVDPFEESPSFQANPSQRNAPD